MRRIDFEARLRAKAWQDEEFQKRLVADPKGTVEAELALIEEGVALPDDVKVRVVEEDAEEICVVIPKHPEQAAGRALTHEELEAVAGGATSDSSVIATAVTTSVLDACSVVTCMEVTSVIGGSGLIVGSGDS